VSWVKDSSTLEDEGITLLQSLLRSRKLEVFSITVVEFAGLAGVKTSI
jgi:hypothetical protein